MLVTEVISLLELLRGLIERKQEIDRTNFEHFIEPVWDQFEKVHADYIASFRSYRALVVDQHIEKYRLIERIQQDSLLTRDLRLGLAAMVEALPVKLERNRIVDEFVTAVERYFNTAHLDVDPCSPDGAVYVSQFRGPNISRVGAIIRLSGMSAEDYETFNGYFAELVDRLQSQYGEAAVSYQRLKRVIFS